MKIFRSLPFLFFAALVSLLLTSGEMLADDEKKQDKGVWIERKDGSWLNLLIEERNFQVHFFDEEREPVDPDVESALIHYSSRILQDRQSVALAPARGKEVEILTSERIIRHPYQFDLMLILVLDEEGKETENLHVIFRQAPDPSEPPSNSPPPPYSPPN